MPYSSVGLMVPKMKFHAILISTLLSLFWNHRSDASPIIISSLDSKCTCYIHEDQKYISFMNGTNYLELSARDKKLDWADAEQGLKAIECTFGSELDPLKSWREV